MKLTPAQREVLKLVGKQRCCETTVRTTGTRVSGTCAAALVRKGLLKYVSHDYSSNWRFDVVLTPEGEKRLAELS